MMNLGMIRALIHNYSFLKSYHISIQGKRQNESHCSRSAFLFPRTAWWKSHRSHCIPLDINRYGFKAFIFEENLPQCQMYWSRFLIVRLAKASDAHWSRSWRAWAQVFIVVDVWAWPRRLNTVLISWCCVINSASDVCRKPWKGICGSGSSLLYNPVGTPCIITHGVHNG